MNKSIVSLVKYEKSLESVRKVIDQAKGFEKLKPGFKVFIKPNIVCWFRGVEFPKWGVITTSRVMEDLVVLLKERGINDITIGEGIISFDPKDNEAVYKDAWEKLGYLKLQERYGVKLINLFEAPYKKIDIGCDFLVEINEEALKSDFFIDVPVLKTHAQARVSLGLKNLKGLLNMATRKKFHSANPEKDLHYNIAHFVNLFKNCLTIIDGIYTLERGPTMDGSSHRHDILIASTDMLSADLVGAKVLGFEPADVPHLAIAAKIQKRPSDLSDIETNGEKIEALMSHHEWDFPYNEAGDLPIQFHKHGMKGIKYPKYDSTLCSYCSVINGILLMGIKFAWDGRPFDNIEILTGKIKKPTPGMNKTILVGQCMCNANKNHPGIKEMILIKGCPPSKEAIKEGLEKAGIDVPDMFYKNFDKAPGMAMVRYKDKPEFDPKFYEIV
nr:DUF362 domain-containing protein [Candidatus Sigynarchaeota archaeon]